MAVFVYKARSKSGEKVDGTIEANDRRAAMRQIEGAGHIPVSVVERSASEKTKGGKGKTGRFRFQLHRGEPRMSMRDVLVFTTELSDLLASGMTLGNALNSLANRNTGRAEDEIITALRDSIVQGASLSEALEQHPRTFSSLYASMIRAGEASGALHEVLRRLVAHYERIQELKEKVVMALVYPCIVLVMGIGTMIFSMIFVVPKFKKIFDTLGGQLPLPTQILVNTSEFLVKYGWATAIGLTIGIVLLNRAMKTEKGRFVWHGMLLKTPLIRGIVASAIFANLARTLGTLLGNGVPVLKALSIVERTAGNDVIALELRKARDRVTDGTTISGPLAAGKVFPRMMIDMLSIGEQTGDMTGALTHIAHRYESELDRNVKVFTTALEPILIVFVALMVGFIAVSIIMAVFSMTNSLSV